MMHTLQYTPKKQINKTKMPETIQQFLSTCKLAKYACALEDAGYDDLEFLQTRTEEQLLAIGKMVSMPIGHAQRFVHAIEKSIASKAKSGTGAAVLTHHTV